MLVKLKIEEDEELRNYIKSLIKGQVVSIAREEIIKIIQDVFSEKSQNILKLNPKTILKDLLQQEIKRSLNIGSWNSDYIKKKCDELILQEVKKNFNK